MLRVDTLCQGKYLVVVLCYKHFDPNGSLSTCFIDPLEVKIFITKHK